MSDRAYDTLVRFSKQAPWNLAIPMPCHCPWYEFTKLNPDAVQIVHGLEFELHYLFEVDQLSWAVMKLAGVPYRKTWGPPILPVEE
jgi:hypothetical protein